MKLLTRDQHHLIGEQTRLINQLTACLKAYYPVALSCFSKLAQKSSRAFLRTYPTPEQAAGASVEAIVTVLKQAGHPTAARVAPRIWERLQQPALHADAPTVRAKARLMLALLSQLEPLMEQIAAYDRAIADLFERHGEHGLMGSLPGAGERLAPRLLAELGDDPAGFRDVNRFQKLAGTAPVLKASGKQRFVCQRTACIKPLRDVLYLFTMQTIKQEPWAKEYYRKKRAEGKSHAEAVRELANIWVRIICAMRRTHTCYQRAIFEHAQQRHACRAA